MAGQANKKLSPDLLPEVMRVIEGTWEKVAVLLQPRMFDTGRITVIKKESDSEFMRASTMLQQWCSMYDDKAANQKIIVAMCKTGLVNRTCEIFGTKVGRSCSTLPTR